MLRLGTNEDFDVLYTIYMHPTVNPYLSFEIMSKEDFWPLFRQLKTAGTLYVYENSDGQIVATCITSRQELRFSHIVGISTFATHPDYQRQGFGTKFMREIIAEIRKNKDIKRIELYAEKDNDNALKFYKKLGYQEEACLKKYYKRATEKDYVDELILAIIFD